MLGRNGTGKTTLLNLVVSLCQGAWDTISENDYDLSFSVICKDRVRLDVTLQSVSDQADPAPDITEQALLSALRTHQRKLNLRIELKHEHDVAATVIISRGNQTEFFFPDGTTESANIDTSSGWLVLTPIAFRRKTGDTRGDFLSTYVDLVTMSNQLVRFDEGLDYFRLLTEHDISKRNVRIAAFTDLKMNLYTIDIIGTRLVPFEVAKLLLDDYSNNGEYQFGFISDAQAPYLERFCSLTEFEHATLVVDLDEKNKRDSIDVVTLTPLRFAMSRNDNRISHRQLSFGQKRLLAFLHFLACNSSPVVADELVNGMHYEWIAECFSEMSSRQAFLSSQNPLLFDFLEFESVEEVAGRFIVCRYDDKNQFVWSNMTLLDAYEFYETYRMGVQQVSEILRTRGYW